MTDKPAKRRGMPDDSQREVASSPIPRRMKRPSWLDLRLITGVALVLASVLTGAIVMSAADKRSPMWTLTRDVTAGTVLQAGDLRAVEVQLGAAAAHYLPASQAVVGRQVLHSIRAGQFLPRVEVDQPAQGVSVTIPVRPENSPRISQGDRITAWVTTKRCRGAVLLSGAAVQDVRSASAGAFGGGATIGLLVRLTGVEARRAVAALDLDGAVIRIGLLSFDEQAQTPEPNLDRCAGNAP